MPTRVISFWLLKIDKVTAPRAKPSKSSVLSVGISHVLHRPVKQASDGNNPSGNGGDDAGAPSGGNRLARVVRSANAFPQRLPVTAGCGRKRIPTATGCSAALSASGLRNSANTVHASHASA